MTERLFVQQFVDNSESHEILLLVLYLRQATHVTTSPFRHMIPLPLKKPRVIQLEKILLWSGRGAGIAGTLLCAVAVLSRLSGQSRLGTFEALTLLQAGVAGLVFACFCLLAVVTNTTPGSR